MCGRFNLRTPTHQLVEIFDLVRVPDAADLAPRYNIAPTQPVAAIRQTDLGRELALLRWGLIPPWADDPKIGNRMINARAETVATKPAFRSAFRERRCLIPADGFYEWKRLDSRRKQPYCIATDDGSPLALAGLWERWRRGGESIESCTILTTEANELLAEMHDRMPVVLPRDAWDRWLDPDGRDLDELQSLLVPFPAVQMRAWPVSPLVNNPRHEEPGCIEPLVES